MHTSAGEPQFNGKGLARDSWLLQEVRDRDWQRQLHGRCGREGGEHTGLEGKIS